MNNADRPSLFSPITLGNLTIRNRLWVSPMCQYAIDREDGVPTDWQFVHLASLARGGAGLVMTEATGVSAEGRISAEDTGIYTDEQARAWARIVDFIHSQGAAAGIQLAHAGRKASVFREWGPNSGTRPIDEGGWQTVAPSAIAFQGYDTPRALSLDEVGGIVEDFVAAAIRSIDAGFDVLEIHAAHGYLLHQFLSPLSNQRDDQYGGSLENRARLLLEVTKAVRAAVGERAVIFVRFSATDYVEGGWDVEQTGTVAAWAREAGADFFDISSGGLVADARITVGPGYQVDFATSIAEASGAPVCAVGLITTAQQADEIVRSGRADAVMMGRKLLRDPNFPQRAEIELGLESGLVPAPFRRAGWAHEYSA